MITQYQFEQVQKFLAEKITRDKIAILTGVSHATIDFIRNNPQKYLDFYAKLKNPPEIDTSLTKKLYQCPEHGTVHKTRHLGPCLACFIEQRKMSV